MSNISEDVVENGNLETASGVQVGAVALRDTICSACKVENGHSLP